MGTDKFKFDTDLEKNLNKKDYMIDNKPIVYIICNKNKAYVGISEGISTRMKTHLKDARRQMLDTVYVVHDERFNGSVIKEIEKYLIRFMSSSREYELQNKNRGQAKDHIYSNKEEFYDIFKGVWEALKKENIVTEEIPLIENSTIYKFSPYTYLNSEQYKITQSIIKDIKQGEKQFLINGGPGTGKTVLALYLTKYIIDNTDKDLKIGFVVPSLSLRGTLKEVFKHIKGFEPEMILRPTQVAYNKYDILIVDEAHRLKRRKALSRNDYRDFDNASEELGLDKDTTNELEMIKKSSNTQILFYDKLQKIRKADIEHEVIEKYAKNSKKHELLMQNRVKGGKKYIEFINDILHQKLKAPITNEFNSYDFRMFNNFKKLKNALDKKEEKYKMCRLIAGYGWKWDKKAEWNFKIEEIKLKWNSKISNWINSKDSKNEVGCIHTIQGYDLNYAGVIIGPEVTFDEKQNKIKIIKENYKDRLGHYLAEEQELEEFIKDIYFVLLTRGIRGTYVYICDEKLREYFKRYVKFE